MTSTPKKCVLSEYEDLCRLIEETEADLERLKRNYQRHATDIVKGSNPNFPYEARHFRVEGVSYDEYKGSEDMRRIEKTLKERKEIASRKRLEVEDWINGVPARIARIVRMKYFKHMTWFDVGMAMGGLGKDMVRMELRRYVEKVESGEIENDGDDA